MKQEEELIWESYILLESFKDYRQKKKLELEDSEDTVMGYNMELERLDKVIENFKKERQRLKPPYNDIGYWMDKSVQDLEYHLEDIPLSKRQLNKRQKSFDISGLKKDPNVDLIYFEGGIVAFGVRNFEGAAKWASQTTDWCVTKDEGHYESYTEDSVFVFVFNLNKEPYNIHNEGGDPESKLAYRFNSDGDIRDVHNAPDNEVSNDQDYFDTPFFEDIKEWVINNFDEISGVDFDKLYDEADSIADEANSNLVHGYISIDGSDKDDWSVSGYFSYDLSLFHFKEDIENLDKKIKDILDDHCDYHDHEYHETGEFNLYINPEYGYGRSFEGGNNPIIDAVREVESIIEDLDKSYYFIYYRIYNDFVGAGLIEDDDPISKLLNIYEHIVDNHIVIIITGKNIHAYSGKFQLNMLHDITDYIMDRFKTLKHQISSQLELPIGEATNKYRGQPIDVLLPELFNIRSFIYGHLGVGVDIEVLEALELATRRMSSREEPKREEELNLKVVYKILEDDEKLKSDIKNIMNNYLHTESKTTFKKVFYS
jgi:hypothetical protein